MVSLKIIGESNKLDEIVIQKNINDCINRRESMVFESGAGSGKTYALVESIKHSINNFGEELIDNGQKIICITYTNVATKEIKDRLQHSELVLVSTIHERMWALISRHQEALIKVHTEKLLNEIEQIEILLSSEKYDLYNALESTDKEQFFQQMSTKGKEFQDCYNLKSASFREKMNPIIPDYAGLLSNVAIFKKLVTSLFRKERYSEAIEGINSHQDEFLTLEYTPQINRDRLEKMQISHDTLLEYGVALFRLYPRLRQLIIDRYPLIFIDEYQDTNPLVIECMKLLQDTSTDLGHPLFIGYYGDSAQNIYSYGVGNKLLQFHPGLKFVDKRFNRRSTAEVIDAINKIRADGLCQESVYTDSHGGSVEFYSGTSDDIQGMIERSLDDWKGNNDKIACLVLTNKDVASQSGFLGLYEAVKKMPRYQGIGYEQLNSEFLNNDLSKLGYTHRVIYRLMELYVRINDLSTPIVDIMQKEALGKLNIEELRGIINQIKQVNGNDLFEYLKNIIQMYGSLEKESQKMIIEDRFPDKRVEMDSIIDMIKWDWIRNSEDMDEQEVNDYLSAFLSIPINELECWYRLIAGEKEETTSFFTYHGTKGLEFDNVIIIMGNGFGRVKDYFNIFFSQYPSKELVSEDAKMKYNEIRNLLYVSCSRAIHNLRILYTDDISGFEDGISSIFGDIIMVDDKIQEV